ncbi:MAG: cytochrome b/b6 domain-containing protein [Pyrobaculum sp.]
MSSVNSKEIEVASVGYKIAHHLNIVLFTLLAITGSLLLFPDLLSWFVYAFGYPLASLLGTPPVSTGAELARTSHRFLGIIWGVFLLVYAIYLIAFRRVEVLRPLGKPLRRQVAEAAALVKHYTLGTPLPKDVAEQLDRHNVLVAYMTMLLFIGVAMLSGSGVAIVYKDYLGLTTNDVRFLLLVHDLGFYLSLLFVFAHLYATLHPSNRPLLLAMFGYGKVSLEWARSHMARYVYRRGAT